MIRQYFTLEDFVKHFANEWPMELDLGLEYHYPQDETYLSFLYSLLYTIAPTAQGNFKSEQANTLFCKYIAPKFKELAIDYADCEITDDMKDVMGKNFIRKFNVILNSSFLKYAKLIEAYEAEKDHLLDDVKSASETKFNDTPQNVQGNFSFDTDEHLTNVSRTESSNQVATKMARINELDALLKDYYSAWSNEFGGLFMYE